MNNLNDKINNSVSIFKSIVYGAKFKTNGLTLTTHNYRNKDVNVFKNDAAFFFFLSYYFEAHQKTAVYEGK